MAVENAGILGLTHTPAYTREVAIDNARRVNMTCTAVKVYHEVQSEHSGVSHSRGTQICADVSLC